MNSILKYIKSNIGFITTLIFLAAIAFSPKAKSLVLRGLIRTGLYEPDVSDLKAKSVTVAQQQAQLAPSVVFESATGERVDISSAKGKVIFLNFWATWCPPCIAEMPSINSLRHKLNMRSNILFVMVDIDNNLNSSMAFMKKNGYKLPVYVQSTTVPQSLFRGNVPTTVIINKRGDIVFQHEGMADYNSQEMSEFLKQLAMQ